MKLNKIQNKKIKNKNMKMKMLMLMKSMICKKWMNLLKKCMIYYNN